jgi:transcriptional regulator with XRE-family HTH domain
MTINERLKEVREALKLSQKAISEALGVKQSYYSEVENGKRKVTARIINSLIVKYGISVDWLMTGKGVLNITKSYIELTGFDDVKYGGNKIDTNQLDEISLIEEIEQNKQKINTLYNRIIDVRILIEQNLGIKNDYATNQEAEILNRLTSPIPFIGSDNKEYSGIYENLDISEKIQYNEQLKKAANLFTTVFFENFKVLYKGLRKDLKSTY